MDLRSKGLGERVLKLRPGQLEIEALLGPPLFRGYCVSPGARDVPGFLGSREPSVCVQEPIEIGKQWARVATAMAAASEITVMHREGEDHGELGP